MDCRSRRTVESSINDADVALLSDSPAVTPTSSPSRASPIDGSFHKLADAFSLVEPTDPEYYEDFEIFLSKSGQVRALIDRSPPPKKKKK
eukprot:SAG11_NODE_298_length_11076_cov_4.253621_8_plen_90_part_00